MLCSWDHAARYDSQVPESWHAFEGDEHVTDGRKRVIGVSKLSLPKVKLCHHLAGELALMH